MSFLGRCAARISGLVIASGSLLACSCAGVNGRTAWEIAEKEARDGTAIFEGTPERVAVQWDVLTARPGDLIHAISVSEYPNPDLDRPRTLITFRVKRVYKGNLGPTVQVATGNGGGDCGAEFATGLDHLVYASGRDPAHLSVDMCSPGGWVGRNDLSTELRYLRKERPRAADLMPLHRRTSSAVADSEKNRKEFAERYEAATGQICGVVDRSAVGNEEIRTIDFLPTIGFPLHGSPSIDVKDDGRFCSGRLGPGEYYLRVSKGLLGGGTALYYPGVSEPAKAVRFRVEAGRVTSGVVFRIPKLRAYSVRGFLSADNKIGVGSDEVSVILVSLDGQIRDRTSVDFRTGFPLFQTKYFSFADVLPGRYRAFAWASGWLTSVAEVNVTTHGKLVFLKIKN